VTLEEAREAIEENYDDLADGIDDEALEELGLLDPGIAGVIDTVCRSMSRGGRPQRCK